MLSHHSYYNFLTMLSHLLPFEHNFCYHFPAAAAAPSGRRHAGGRHVGGRCEPGRRHCAVPPVPCSAAASHPLPRPRLPSPFSSFLFLTPVFSSPPFPRPPLSPLPPSCLPCPHLPPPPPLPALRPPTHPPSPPPRPQRYALGRRATTASTPQQAPAMAESMRDYFELAKQTKSTFH